MNSSDTVYSVIVVTVHSLSHIQLFVTPWTAALQTSLFFTGFQSLLRFMSTESVMPFNHLTLCCPLLLLPSIIPSIRVFSKESVLRIRWPKYWSFSLSISPSNEYSGLISFRIDWLYFLAVQGTLKSLLQHHSSKASILRLSAFFIVTIPYIRFSGLILLKIEYFYPLTCISQFPLPSAADFLLCFYELNFLLDRKESLSLTQIILSFSYLKCENGFHLIPIHLIKIYIQSYWRHW